MAGDGLGFSGAGGGMFNSILDAGIGFGSDLGRAFVASEFGTPAGINQATRIGLTPGQLSVVNQQPGANTIGGIDQKTIMIGLGLLVVAVVLAKAM